TRVREIIREAAGLPDHRVSALGIGGPQGSRCGTAKGTCRRRLSSGPPRPQPSRPGIFFYARKAGLPEPRAAGIADYLTGLSSPNRTRARPGDELADDGREADGAVADRCRRQSRHPRTSVAKYRGRRDNADTSHSAAHGSGKALRQIKGLGPRRRIDAPAPALLRSGAFCPA